jgi:hypothetical protein
MALTLVVAAALPFLLPARFSLGPRWIIPLVEILLLATLVVGDPGANRQTIVVRAGTLHWSCSHSRCRGGGSRCAAGRRSHKGRTRDSPGQLIRVGSVPYCCTSSSRSPFSTGSLTAVGQSPVHVQTPSSRILHFPSTSTLALQSQGGRQSSSTTSIWVSPTPRRSALPM